MKAAGPAALIAAEQAEDAGSECPYGRIEPGRGTDRVAHRHRERRGFDLEHVAGLRLDTLAERQRRGAEKMDVDIAGAAEAGIFEMVVFEVADRVRHIRLTRDEGLFPRSDEHTSELQSLMRLSYAVLCLKTKKHTYK